MQLSQRALNRASLGRQMMLARERRSVEEAMGQIVALQAQHPASPYVGLWNRLVDWDPAELDAAWRDGSVVRTGMVRGTLHAATPADYRIMRESFEPGWRAFTLNSFVRDSGLTAEHADNLLPGLLELAREPVSSDEIDAWLRTQVDVEVGTVGWRWLRGYAPLVRAPDDTPWNFGANILQMAPPELPLLGDPEAPDRALQQLALRYLSGFGPANIADIATFTGVQRKRVKAALDPILEQLEHHTDQNDKPLYDVPGGLLPDEDTPAPVRLLPMWDNLLLAWHDRTRHVPEQHRKTIIRVNGDALPTVLVDGYVAGVWQATDAGIEVKMFEQQSKTDWAAIESEALGMQAFLAGRDPVGFRQARSWWPKIDGAETRLFSI